MAQIRDAWPALRAILPEYFTFNSIKTILAASGLNIQRLSHLQQKSGSSISKGNLLDEIEKVLFGLDEDMQNRIVTYCMTEMIKMNPRCQDRLEELLFRLGWGISGTEPYPISLQITLDTAGLPEDSQAGLHKALQRYRDGDASGAVTAICGIVDKFTEKIYNDHHIGNHKEDSYHERVAKSYNILENKFKSSLKASGFNESEVDLTWQNQRKAIAQSAYVLGSYRRNISDAHGEQKVSPELVQYVIDNATFVVRSLSIYFK